MAHHCLTPQTLDAFHRQSSVVGARYMSRFLEIIRGRNNCRDAWMRYKYLPRNPYNIQFTNCMLTYSILVLLPRTNDHVTL